MPSHWFSTRTHGEEPPATREVSRLIVLVFVVAVILGVVTGAGWVAWNLIKNQLIG